MKRRIDASLNEGRKAAGMIVSCGDRGRSPASEEEAEQTGNEAEQRDCWVLKGLHKHIRNVDVNMIICEEVSQILY